MLAAAIRALVVTTDPLIDELLLREIGDSSLFRWWCGMVGVSEEQMTLFEGLVRLRRIRDCVLAEGCGGRV